MLSKHEDNIMSIIGIGVGGMSGRGRGKWNSRVCRLLLQKQWQKKEEEEDEEGRGEVIRIRRTSYLPIRPVSMMMMMMAGFDTAF